MDDAALGLLGFFIGVLPGAGATIASAMCYAMERRMAGKDHQFGSGDIRGVAAPEAGQQHLGQRLAGADADPGRAGLGHHRGDDRRARCTTSPGPTLFQDQPVIVWGLIASLFIANVMLLVLNIPLIRVFVRFLSIPNWLLVPGVAAISGGRVYGAWHDLRPHPRHLIGGVGYLLRVMNFPIIALHPRLCARRHDGAEPPPRLSISDSDVGVCSPADLDRPVG